MISLYHDIYCKNAVSDAYQTIIEAALLRILMVSYSCASPKVARVLQTPTFKKAVKKLKPNQKKALDAEIKALMAEPERGEQKRGNLTFLRVHKFKMNKQLTLLGYSFDAGNLTLELMALDSYENFYRDIKRRK